LCELAVDFGIEGVGGLASLLLFVAVVDVLAEGVELLADLVGLLGEIFAGHTRINIRLNKKGQ
jgi:hypothetical protein